MTATLTVIGIGVLALLWYWGAFNDFRRSLNASDQAWSNVEVELKRRFDLIDNLVAVVKGYAVHESTALQKVTALRTGTADARRANPAEPEIKSALGSIMMLVEAYPDLKADAQFLRLQTELAETENRIAARRLAYNQTVNLYRNLFESFPTNLVAALQTLPPRDFFDAPPEAAAVPQVELGHE